FFFVLAGLAVCGFGTGALYSLPISMYADCVSIERAQSGENNSGVFSGFMTLAYNISNCLALFIVGVLLDLIKFNPAQPVQALVVQNWMGVIVFVGCGLAIFGAFLIFRKYTLKRSEVLKSRMKNQ
ncbi:MAG: MFS transporter, partial [Clostridia bacterium]|nr:MFS transporter [Clostridia bacterium]